MSKTKKQDRCRHCDADLICCTVKGKPAKNGAYRVCPLALIEFDPQSFSLPYKRRSHERAEILEGATARKNRLAEKRNQPLLFEDTAVGKRPKSRRIRHQLEVRGLE
jgi:hypothetical protein